jgi:RES domain-containing protein
LPANWFAADPPSKLQSIGAEWLERADSALLKVPSAIVIEEWNYLLNPLHPDFRKLRVSAPKPFNFDQRVARSGKKSGVWQGRNARP